MLRERLTEKHEYFSITFLVITSLILIGYLHSSVYGQALNKGIIGQVVGDEKTQFYVHDVKVIEESGNKIVDVSVVIKNKGTTQQEFTPNSLRLVDSQSRQYDPDYNPILSSLLGRSSTYIPRDDINTWHVKFKILPSNNASKIYFFPDRFSSESRFVVDLTKSKNPADSPPNSSWVLSSNKGVKVDNRQLELTINDEKYVGNTYIIDVTIKNVGNSAVPYDASNFKVKDMAGESHSRNFLLSLASPLLSGDLPPDEMVRGDIAFDVEKPGGNMMIIYAGSSGVPFLNTGSSSAQASRPPSGNSIKIVLGSWRPSNAESFVPEILSVTKGTTVHWSNNDTTLHTVTSGTPENIDVDAGTEFDSSFIPAGKTFEHTFNETGVFDYFCTLHPYMKAEIDVK